MTTPLYAIVLHVRGSDFIPYHIAVAALPHKGELIVCGYTMPEPLRGYFRVTEVVHHWPQDVFRDREPHADVYIEHVDEELKR